MGSATSRNGPRHNATLYATQQVSTLPLSPNHSDDDGDRYQGQFARGERDGYGRLSYADGSIYEGYFVDSAKHGYGCFLKDRHLHFGYMIDDRLGPNMVTVKIREDEDVSRSLMNILQDLLSNGEVCAAKHTVIAQFLEDSKNGA